MSRFEELISTVETYNELTAENYNRIRKLADELKTGFSDFLAAKDGRSVLLVPPAGQFQPKDYGDEAFSMPPRGFRPLGPVAFGLAIRVTRGTDWIRATLLCSKTGDEFMVQIENGPQHQFRLPLSEAKPEIFYELLFAHIRRNFEEKINRYNDGDYGDRGIGFDFVAEETPPSSGV